MGLHYYGTAEGSGNHWLQFVVTNSSHINPNTPVFTDPNGDKYFIDGPQAQFKVPFIDTALYAYATFDSGGANGDILDVVGQEYDHIYGELYTFVAWFPAGDPQGQQKILNVALNGINWGFTMHDPKGQKLRGARKPLYPPPDFIPGTHGFDFLWGARPKNYEQPVMNRKKGNRYSWIRFLAVLSATAGLMAAAAAIPAHSARLSPATGHLATVWIPSEQELQKLRLLRRYAPRDGNTAPKAIPKPPYPPPNFTPGRHGFDFLWGSPDWNKGPLLPFADHSPK